MIEEAFSNRTIVPGTTTTEVSRLWFQASDVC